MKRTCFKVIGILFLIALHLFLLTRATNYQTPELIFPVWLLTSAKTYVSEIGSFYPPVLFYLVSFASRITGSLYLASTLTQLIFVAASDFLLFGILTKKFKYKLALVGLIFYIPWQIYFRGNYLWFDFPTIPFLAISFLYFSKYVNDSKIKNLLISSIFLSVGYFFKNTILYIYLLYLVWVVYIETRKRQLTVLFYRTLTLFLPLFISVLVNFFIQISRSTFEFAFYWFILMQNLIYPRMSTLPRLIPHNYIIPLSIIISVFIVSLLIIKKKASGKSEEKYFMFSFSLVTFFNIFPRWSDFHVQPFLFFLPILFVYAISLKKKLTKIPKAYFNFYLVVLLFMTLAVFSNRILSEAKRSNANPNYFFENSLNKEKKLISSKNVFVGDFAFYNGVSTNKQEMLKFDQKLYLAVKNPDLFYRQTSPRIALDYLLSKNPQVIIVPTQIKDKLDSGDNLNEFEENIINKYAEVSQVTPGYYLFILNPPNR